ncbi:DUF2971 domain-containing protein [Enterobacter cloacae]|uniref:DUF2971 domain-containing protein n=1 Tax=Enterobacter cloacae TaxID=550 RepID=UPI002006B574|nr:MULTISPECIES: DUF2971 domain-containing protein [Enterobacter]MCK7164561.1 DUF2971 domain-containing protein [Enterobacter cloacae]
MKFYKYVSAETAKIIITEGTLKFTSPVNFNDPFDYYPAVLEKGFHKFANRLNTEIGNGIKRYRTTHRESQKHIQALRSGEFRHTYTRDMSISCFSKSPFILPMWAHYANNHKGCVIEFEFDSKKHSVAEYFSLGINQLSKILIPFEVIYSTNRPPLYDEHGKTNTSNTGFNACLTKSKEWEYEKEMRVVTKQVEGVYPFERTQMTGLYFGMKMESTDKRDLSRIIDSSNNYTETRIRKHDVVIAYDKFELSKIQFRI